METTFTVTILATGEHSKAELQDFIRFSLGFGGCSQENPFIRELDGAEIINVETNY